MYHDVIAVPSGTPGGTGFFAVMGSTFEAQLDQILDLGYRGCTVERAVAEPADADVVAISFDDGNAGQYERAFPALVRRGMAATFYVTTGWVGRPGYVSWEALREMKAAGMSIQSHTRTHPFLSELGAEALRSELEGSRAALDERLDQRTQALALPGGDPPRAALRGLLREAGYTIIATSRWGVNRTLTPGVARVRRCTIRGAMAAAEFRRVLEGDPVLAWRRGLREGALRAFRTSVGPRRYARWRKRVLDLFGPRHV